MPGLGISGIDLTSAYPRGVWGKQIKLTSMMWSKHESIRAGSQQVHPGNLTSRIARVSYYKFGTLGYKKCSALEAGEC